MQCILREKLMAQAMKLAGVSNVYRTESYRFVDAYIAWLEEAEKDLSGLRSPIVILLQAEKSSVISVLDGFLPNDIQAGKSIRKSQKAVAAQSLEKVSKEIYSKIENIDNTLDQSSEKLCHAIAVLAIKKPELYKKLKVDQNCVETIWKMLGRTPETIPTYNYFCAKLASTDINYLLMDIIQKIVTNKTDAFENRTHSSQIC
ncbi:MAG: hypothetical protein O8C61_04820 [Candidatus Methanoperedens sp.]|nr:hypothetical protein [Candidatus Methanoperedens sp.]